MLRLADRIMLQGPDNWELPDVRHDPELWGIFRRDVAHLINRLQKKTCPIIIADNICTFLLSATSQPEQLHDIGHGQATPPFANCFIEWIDPRYSELVGAHIIHGNDSKDLEILNNKLDVAITSYIYCKYFYYGSRKRVGYSGQLDIILLDADGNMLGVVGRDDNNNDRELHLATGIITHALAFMNCKNVVIQGDTHEYAQPAKWYRRTKVPQVSYHTINIQPRTVRCNPNPTSTGIQQRLHICRGHFMHYKEDGPGMFGRGVYGRFWVPQHPRGSKELGEVNARYTVSPPDFNLTSANTMV